MTASSHRRGPASEAGGADAAWQHLSTEKRHPKSRALDTLSSEQIVDLLLAEDRRGLEVSRRHQRSIARAADWMVEALDEGGSVVFVGAGSSGRLGVLEAAECPPTFGTDPDRIRAVIAGGPEAVFRAEEGAEDREDEGRVAAEGLSGGDLLFALSASAVTPFIRGALAAARRQGVRTVLLTCAGADERLPIADLLIALDTGPEILTGSTRLKAGSATKAVLNAITTTAMVRWGKVFDNLMVDLRAGSAKLRDRALRIVEAVGGVSRSEAIGLLADADGEVKTAIVMARCGVSVEIARRRLREHRGHLRAALAADGPE